MAGNGQPISEGKTAGCGLALLILGVIVATSFCSRETTPNTNTAALSGADENLAATTTESSPPPPLQPLSASSARRGIRHFKLAKGAEGAAGELVYSQNCYDALARHFSWSKLDVCGGFDMAAADAISSDVDATNEQSTYFDSETAAGRYLAAATKAGEPTADADRRLSALQRLIPRPRPVETPDAEVPKATPNATDTNAVANESVD